MTHVGIAGAFEAEQLGTIGDAAYHIVGQRHADAVFVHNLNGHMSESTVALGTYPEGIGTAGGE